MRERKSIRRALCLTAAVLFLGIPAEAYYHYIYYPSYSNGASLPAGALQPVRAAFNLAALPNNTVTFYVSDAGPANYAPNDSMGSVLGAVRQAIAAWNAVSTSNLRVAFGGLENQNQNENTPGGDVVFIQLPPGVVGLGSPNLPAVPNILTGANGQQFVPIQRATVYLSNDTTQGAGASNTEAFFTTAVHEIGHALGLQHTWTGSAMSQGPLRNTTRARAIDADDRASLSVLYGPANWTSGFGTISGRVTFKGSGQPVVLASVVALPSSGPPVSALTDPNGYYTINGIPPGMGAYLLYVHPLPPGSIPNNGEGIKLPLDQNGLQIQGSTSAFQTVFFPNTGNGNAPTTDWTAAQSFNIAAGSSVTANFAVTAQAAPTMYNALTYGFLDPGARNYTYVNPAGGFIYMSPAYINSLQGESLVGITYLPFTVPLSTTILGGLGSAGPCGNTAPCFLTGTNPLEVFAYFGSTEFPQTGARHMVFSFPNDAFVLPGGVSLVEQGPPYVDSVTPNPDGTVTIQGTLIGSGSTVYFDSLPAAATGPATVTSSGRGTITVTPPAGPGGQVSAVTVYNSDGQNSTFLQFDSLPTYTYPASATPGLTVSPAALAVPPVAGVTTAVLITGTNTQFATGHVTVGFGTSDVTVSHLWVLDASHLLANVVVAPNAVSGTSDISVISDFQVMTLPGGFTVEPPTPSATPSPAIAAVVNNVPSQATIYPGAIASIYGVNLSGVQVTLNGQAAPVLWNGPNQVDITIPANTPMGPVILALAGSNGNTSIVVPINLPPPVILGVADVTSGAALDSTHSASPGDILSLQVSGLDPTVLANPSRVEVLVGGVPMTVQSIQVTSPQQISFTLGQSFGGAFVPITVVVDGSSSGAYTILAQ